MMKKRVKEGSAVLLALILAFSAFALPRAEAADPVDINASCSVDFSVAGDSLDLKDVENGVLIKLYKVASIDASGGYTAEGIFEDLDLSSLEQGGTSADAWAKRAGDAAKLVTGDTIAAAQTTLDSATGTASITGLSTGMYLVAAQEAVSPLYKYQFTPYLISLPNNYYYAGGDDSWVYDLTGEHALSLKPEETPRYGTLRINKKLENQNVTMGEQITFVFLVTITPPNGEPIQKNVALQFDAAGDKSLVIDKIPAGSKVTVEEAYPGAGYKLTTPQTVETEIAADMQAEVGFTNVHDGRITGGYGVVNNYKDDDGSGVYFHKKLEDNSKSGQ